MREKQRFTFSEERVLSCIGSEPIKQHQIAQITGYTRREIREIVFSLRGKNVPICSGNDGYWLGNKEDIRRTIGRLHSEAYAIQQSIRHLSIAMEEIENEY